MGDLDDLLIRSERGEAAGELAAETVALMHG